VGLSWSWHAMRSGVGRVLASTPQVIEPGDGWQYAAWVAVDLRLLLFLMFVALLGALGVCLILVRQRDLTRLLATFIVAYTAALGLLVVVFNVIAHYPVFQVQSFFPFP
jgi:hypothetical protein